MNKHRARENVYQASLKKLIKQLLPGCIVSKQDANQTQGIPDLIVIFGKHWAMLETKRDEDASFRPNQPFYIDYFNKIGFARHVNPMNQNEVLDDLVAYFAKENES